MCEMATKRGSFSAPQYCNHNMFCLSTENLAEGNKIEFHNWINVDCNNITKSNFTVTKSINCKFTGGFDLAWGWLIRKGSEVARRTGDGVVVLGRTEEDAVGLLDLAAECLDGGREAFAAVGLEVGVEERQIGDVEVVDAQARDGLLAHLRGWQCVCLSKSARGGESDARRKSRGDVPARRRPRLKEALRREPQTAATRRIGFADAAAASMLSISTRYCSRFGGDGMARWSPINSGWKAQTSRRLPAKAQVTCVRRMDCTISLKEEKVLLLCPISLTV